MSQSLEDFFLSSVCRIRISRSTSSSSDVILDMAFSRELETLCLPRDSLLIELTDQRQRFVHGARKAAVSLRNDSLPQLDSKVTGKRLRRRMGRVVNDLAMDINRRLSIVLEDANRKRDLHRLRMDCKRPCYNLEIATDDDANGSMSLEILNTMKEWNGLLGAIQDWDVVTSYVKERSPNPKTLLALVAERREQEYQKFVRRCTVSAKSRPPVTIATIGSSGENVQ